MDCPICGSKNYDDRAICICGYVLEDEKTEEIPKSSTDNNDKILDDANIKSPEHE
jgi:hypothetical protein